MSFLNWQNDPLLFDSENSEMNSWITANKLIEINQQDKIFLDNEKLLLNLFPIIVRKIDFIRENSSDRILSRFPFKKLSENEIKQIREKDLLIAEVARDYFYRSIDNGILEWRVGIRNYLERGAMPYPLLRCAWEVINEITNQDEKITFESAKGKQYKLPTKLTKQLAYLCGVCNGDGHLHRHWLRIVDETKEHIQFLSTIMEQLFGEPGELFKTENAWNLELRSFSAVRLINFLTDQTIEGAKYDSLREPLIFRKLDDDFRNLYWRGAMDADGSYTNQISFTSSSKKFVEDFQTYLEIKSIESKFIETKINAYMIIIPAKFTLSFAELIGVSNPKKQYDIYQLLQRKRYSNQFKGLKEGVLTSEGYFNFQLLTGLQVIGMENFLKEFRDERTFYEMRDLLELSQGSYSNYEKNERAIPLTLISRIIEQQNHHGKTLMKLLDENSNDILFKSSTSEAIKLPMKPSKELDELLPILDPRESYLNICETDKRITNIFHSLFNVLLKETRINNRLIVHYLNTFFEYDLTNAKIEKEEFVILKRNWEEMLQ